MAAKVFALVVGDSIKKKRKLVSIQTRLHLWFKLLLFPRRYHNSVQGMGLPGHPKGIPKVPAPKGVPQRTCMNERRMCDISPTGRVSKGKSKRMHNAERRQQDEIQRVAVDMYECKGSEVTDVRQKSNRTCLQKEIQKDAQRRETTR